MLGQSSLAGLVVVRRSGIARALLVVALLAWGLTGPAIAGPPFSPGDLVIGLGSSPDGVSQGLLRHFSPSGALLNSLYTTSGSFEETGACFDASLNLYTTNFEANTMSKFGPNAGLLAASFGSSFNQDPNSCVVDGAGNLYVGLSNLNGGFGGGGVLKLDSAGNVLGSFNTLPDQRGTDWVDLAADQCTLFYTSVGSSIKRFDVCNNAQLGDFCTSCDDGAGGAATGPLFALRLLSAGGVLVADWNGFFGNGVVRRYDAAGVQVGAYIATDSFGSTCGIGGDEPCFHPWALGLDPDRTSVWVADNASGEVFRFDLATGAVLSQFLAGNCDDFLSSCAVTGMAVAGEPTVATSGPAVVTASITAANKTYDGTIDATITSCTLSGVHGFDDVSCVATGGAFDTANAGTGKPVTAAVSLTGAAAGQYGLSSSSAATNADIIQAPASVTPNPAGKTYGAADPALTGTLSGFLGADGVTASYARAAGESVVGGPYAISATLSPAGALTNYSITYHTAPFAIAAAAAAVTPNPAGKTYGAADPALTGTLSGFLASDGVIATFTRAAGESVVGGPYAIAATLGPAAALTNYAITYGSASFTIAPAPASVTPNPASKAYGAPDPALGGALVGFLGADGVTATYGRTAGESVAGSPYAISATLGPSAALLNYAITYNTANFAITQVQADVSVTKTTSTPAVNAGDPISYNVVVASGGPASASGVVLTDTLPSGLDWTVSGADAAACGVSGPVPGGTVLSCSFDALAPGATRGITLSAVTSAATCGVISNTATVTSTADANSADPNLSNNSSGPVSISVNCSCGALPCQVPPKNPANVVTVTSCTAPAVTTSGNWTQINMPAADVVLKCALAQLPGTTGVRIVARSIKVDGTDAAHVGSITTSGVQGIQLTASASTCSDATVEILSATLRDNNNNGGIKVTACGEVVINSSTLASAGQNVTVTTTGGRICADSDALAGNSVAFTSQGDLWMRNSSVLTVGPRDSISLTSTAGSVLAGGGSGPAPCLPNQFKGQNESNLSFTANGIVDQTNACIDIAENITITAAGAGKNCAADTIVSLAGAEVRNDFAKTGLITVSACANQGGIDITGAIIVDEGAKGGGANPNAVATLNGGKVSTSSCPALPANPPRPSCSTRLIDLSDNPVCADPADRALRHVLGQPAVDR